MADVMLATSLTSAAYWPFVILILSMALVVTLITLVRVHAFLALIVAAIFAGLLARQLPGEPQTGHWVQAVELTTVEFGTTAGKIGVVICLAAIIGTCLMESGAADKVVRRFLAFFGEKRAGFALFSSSYVLSIPIFFDTFFMLLLPIARALRLRTGRDYLLFVMAICCSGVVTHILIAPHPGPLAVAGTLNLDLGLTLLVGLPVGVIPALCAWFFTRWLNRRIDIPLRGVSQASAAEIQAVLARPESELPSFAASILPVLGPIVLISAASSLAALHAGERFPRLACGVEFAGNRNMALLIGAVIAMRTLARQKGYSLAQVCQAVGPSLETAGVIILITSAGGAFGQMLKNAGVGDAVKTYAADHGMNLVLLAWLVSSVIRIAQGSATVAMLTTSAMMASILYPSGDPAGAVLAQHPIYIFLAIGFGAVNLSWMNDSGFWVVSKLSGFTEKETLKTWTLMTVLISVVGLMVTLVLAAVWPFGTAATS